jgi:hypothetical protein
MILVRGRGCFAVFFPWREDKEADRFQSFLWFGLRNSSVPGSK